MKKNKRRRRRRRRRYHNLIRTQFSSPNVTSHPVTSFLRRNHTYILRSEAKKSSLEKDLDFEFQLPRLTRVIPEYENTFSNMYY
jgi:hypothetical protein